MTEQFLKFPRMRSNPECDKLLASVRATLHGIEPSSAENKLRRTEILSELIGELRPLYDAERANAEQMIGCRLVDWLLASKSEGAST